MTIRINKPPPGGRRGGNSLYCFVVCSSAAPQTHHTYNNGYTRASRYCAIAAETSGISPVLRKPNKTRAPALYVGIVIIGSSIAPA